MPAALDITAPGALGDPPPLIHRFLLCSLYELVEWAVLICSLITIHHEGKDSYFQC